MLRVASFNINGVRARLKLLTDWLTATRPDVALLQEIKCPTEAFPASELEQLGYRSVVHGQKAYNGVALLAHRAGLAEKTIAIAEDTITTSVGLDDDAQARFLDVTLTHQDTQWHVICVYVPNGNPAPGAKLDYKLRWLEALYAYLRPHLARGANVLVGGDFNICPEDRDCYAPEALREDALLLPQSRARWRALTWMGLADAYRLVAPDQTAWTYWDFRGGAWQRDEGLRIDHFLLSARFSDRLQTCGPETKWRDAPNPSDHTPVRVTFTWP